MLVGGQGGVVDSDAVAGPQSAAQPVRADRIDRWHQRGRRILRAAEDGVQPPARDVFHHDAVVHHVVAGQQCVREQPEAVAATGEVDRISGVAPGPPGLRRCERGESVREGVGADSTAMARPAAAGSGTAAQLRAV